MISPKCMGLTIKILPLHFAAILVIHRRAAVCSVHGRIPNGYHRPVHLNDGGRLLRRCGRHVAVSGSVHERIAEHSGAEWSHSRRQTTVGSAIRHRWHRRLAAHHFLVLSAFSTLLFARGRCFFACIFFKTETMIWEKVKNPSRNWKKNSTFFRGRHPRSTEPQFFIHTIHSTKLSQKYLKLLRLYRLWCSYFCLHKLFQFKHLLAFLRYDQLKFYPLNFYLFIFFFW